MYLMVQKVLNFDSLKCCILLRWGTLVSIGRLDEKGFKTNFSGGKRVGVVPKHNRRLYCVDHESESASVAEEVLTLDQMHRCLGHISVNAAKKLAKDGFITGLQLKTTPSGNDFFCESCVYAKAHISQ